MLHIGFQNCLGKTIKDDPIRSHYLGSNTITQCDSGRQQERRQTGTLCGWVWSTKAQGTKSKPSRYLHVKYSVFIQKGRDPVCQKPGWGFENNWEYGNPVQWSTLWHSCGSYFRCNHFDHHTDNGMMKLKTNYAHTINAASMLRMIIRQSWL